MGDKMEALEKVMAIGSTAVLVAAFAMDQTLPSDVRLALVAMAAACSPRPAELLEKAMGAVKAVRLKYSKRVSSEKPGKKGKGK